VTKNLNSSEEYIKAKEIVEKYKQCAGCKEIFDWRETKMIITWGINWWCPNCWERIKDD